jgi:hypothetical protein
MYTIRKMRVPPAKVRESLAKLLEGRPLTNVSGHSGGHTMCSVGMETGSSGLEVYILEPVAYRWHLHSHRTR